MKKRLFALLLACVMLLGVAVTAHAADAEAVLAANTLNKLGLFNGTGTNTDGRPIFDLDRAPTRHEAVTMLVRMLGKDEEAKAGNWEIPFNDVADWAKPYVGYAYAHGLTSGTSATTFGGNATVSATQYLTFVLRALGYESGKDFQWDKAWELSDAIGLTDGRYNADTKQFLRADAAVVSYGALRTEQKGSRNTLADKLMSDGAFTSDAYKNATDTSDVLKEQKNTEQVPVTFAVDGKMLPNWDWRFRCAAGTYIVTPYLYGELFDEYEVEISSGDGSVSKNGDGTFTVSYAATGNLSITMWYDFKEVTDENGNVSKGRTKRSLGFSPPITGEGFVLDSRGGSFFPGVTFGDNYSPYYVIDVYLDGVRLCDYTVSAADNAPFTASVQADGSLLLMKEGHGEAKFTVTYDGRSATFGLFIP